MSYVIDKECLINNISRIPYTALDVDRPMQRYTALFYFGLSSVFYLVMILGIENPFSPIYHRMST